MLHFTKCYQQNREGAIRIYDLNKGITTKSIDRLKNEIDPKLEFMT